MADIRGTQPIRFPSSELVHKLSIAASALTAAAVTAQAVVAVAQQLGKSREQRAGLEGALRLTVAATVAKALPTILTEVRTLGRELRRS